MIKRFEEEILVELNSEFGIPEFNAKNLIKFGKLFYQEEIDIVEEHDEFSSELVEQACYKLAQFHRDFKA